MIGYEIRDELTSIAAKVSSDAKMFGWSAAAAEAHAVSMHGYRYDKLAIANGNGSNIGELRQYVVSACHARGIY